MPLRWLAWLSLAASVGSSPATGKLCKAAASDDVRAVTEALREGADVNGHGDPVSAALRITQPLQSPVGSKPVAAGRVRAAVHGSPECTSGQYLAASGPLDLPSWIVLFAAKEAQRDTACDQHQLCRVPT